MNGAICSAYGRLPVHVLMDGLLSSVISISTSPLHILARGQESASPVIFAQLVYVGNSDVFLSMCEFHV